MIHFLYLTGFAFFVAIIFAVINKGTLRENFLYGVKVFAQFMVISLVLAWILYFIPL